MANQFVPKAELFDQLRSIFNQKQSGMLTLLTDTKKSVLMRFSAGELTSARCRSWDIANTIEALFEAETVKFSYIRSSSGEDKPPLLPAQDFMLMIEPGGSGLEATADQEEGIAVIPEQAAFEPVEKAQEAPVVTKDEEKKEEGKEDKKAFEVDKVTAARMNYF